MNKVIVFGSTGFVGRYLVKELADHGFTVIGSGTKRLCEKSANSHLASYSSIDITDSESVLQFISQIRPEYIVNLAAISSVGQSWSIPAETMKVNVNGSLNILEAVRKLKINSKVLLIGSSEEYEVSNDRLNESCKINANNPYGVSKVTQELFAELYRNEYGLNIISTRTFNHTGIGQSEKFVIPSFIKQVSDLRLRNGGTISVGNLEAMRDLGDVRDMVSAYRMLLEADTKHPVFNVGSGTCYKLANILNYIISLSKYEVDIQIDPSKLRPLDNPIIWCDNSLIKNEIGWEPRYTIYDTISEMFDFYSKTRLN